MKIKLKCQECHKSFHRIPSRSWSSKLGDYGVARKKYCSSICANKALKVFWRSLGERQQRSKRAMGEKNGRWMGGSALCADCKKPVSLRHGVTRCMKCNGKHGSIKFIGEAARNWQGGRTAFHECIRGLDKTKAWREKIFKRDDFTCRNCNKTHTYLEAHHVKKFSILLSEFLKECNLSFKNKREVIIKLAIKYKPFWDIENGITLCRMCHDKTKKTRKREA